MPSLKDLTCSVELSNDQESLQELGTVYGDAFVETFIPVPRKQQTFTVHLSSNNFIAPGIAMYVFIDGIYQCNRNRQNMKLQKPPDRRSLVDFKVRQKEEKQEDGSMIAREWTFEKLNRVSADSAPNLCSPTILENIGCIEVVVLRCAGPRNSKTTANMNLDGAADYSDYYSDRNNRSRTTAYDDRDPFTSTASHKHSSPPPAPSYHSPYAETVRSRDRTAMQHRLNAGYAREPSQFTIREPSQRAYSRHSEPVSPGTRPQRDIPAPGFHYGSGPLPPRSRAETSRDLMNEVNSSGIPNNTSGVDPALLEKIVTDVVKRKVEESRKKGTSDGGQTENRRYEYDMGSPSQVPGAWPTSPVRPPKHQSQRPVPSDYSSHDDENSTWEQRSKTWQHRPTQSRAETRIGWEEEPGWDKQSRADGWGSPDDNPADSWDTEETWSKKRPEDWEEVRRGSSFRGRTTRNPSPSRRVSDASSRISGGQRSKHTRTHRSRFRSRTPRSHWTEGLRSSSEDNDGWTHLEAPSDSTTSLERSDSTLKPSHSRSQVKTLKSKSARRRSRRESNLSKRERQTSQHIKDPQWHPGSLNYARPPSVLVTNAPTLMSTLISDYPTDVRSRKPSACTQPATPLVAPPPTWGCAGSESARGKSVATTYLPPAPFSVISEHHNASRQSSSSSSWEPTSQGVSKDKYKKSSPQQSKWAEDKISDKAKSSWGHADNKAPDNNEDRAESWGSDKVAEQTDGGWKEQGKESDEWGITKDMKDSAADGWNTDKNEDWSQNDTKEAAVDGWNTKNKSDSWADGWSAAKNTDTTLNQLQDASHNVSFNDAGDLCAAATAVTTVAPLPPPPIAPVVPVIDEKANDKTKPPPPSKRHTSKSLSKYRQLSSSLLSPKPHWQFPPPPSKNNPHSIPGDQKSNTLHKTNHIPSIPPEPLHQIPQSAVEHKGVEHQVLAGSGTQYGHAIGRPEYIDRLDKPYAVFRFKYRSRSMLKELFGRGCLSKKGTVVERDELRALPQEELVKRMVMLQKKLVERKKESRDAESRCTESVAKDLTEKWVQRHSRGPSEEGKGKDAEKGEVASAKSKAKSADKVTAWNDGFKESRVEW